MAIGSMEIGKVIIDALGLPGHIRWLELRCAVDEVVTVKCEIIPPNGDTEKIKNCLRTFEVVERKLKPKDE